MGCKRRRGRAGGQLHIFGEGSCNYGWEWWRWEGSCKNVYCTYIWLWNRVLSLYGICLKQMKTKLSYASHLILSDRSLLQLHPPNVEISIWDSDSLKKRISTLMSCPKSPHFWEKRNLQRHCSRIKENQRERFFPQRIKKVFSKIKDLVMLGPTSTRKHLVQTNNSRK